MMEYRFVRTEEEIKEYLIKIHGERKTKRQLKNREKYKYVNEYKKVRVKVLERDSYKCVKCGSNSDLHVHHIIERCHGGSNDISNLITLCSDCHKEMHKNEQVYKLMNKGA